jgi:hypothetical protein
MVLLPSERLPSEKTRRRGRSSRPIDALHRRRRASDTWGLGEVAEEEEEVLGDLTAESRQAASSVTDVERSSNEDLRSRDARLR